VRVLADGQIHTLTDANRFYNLSHAICYSYGTDNKITVSDIIESEWRYAGQSAVRGPTYDLCSHRNSVRRVSYALSNDFRQRTLLVHWCQHSYIVGWTTATLCWLKQLTFRLNSCNQHRIRRFVQCQKHDVGTISFGSYDADYSFQDCDLCVEFYPCRCFYTGTLRSSGNILVYGTGAVLNRIFIQY